jgi:hypothetical protein
MFAVLRQSALSFAVVSALIASGSIAAFSAEAGSQPRKISAAQQAQLEASYGKLPLSFEANAGQADRQVRFIARGGGYGLYLTSNEAILALHRTSCAGQTPLQVKTDREHGKQPCLQNSAVVTMRVAGAAAQPATLQGEQPLPGTANYFVGSNPAAWQQNVTTYSKVRYGQVYPGIDLVYYGNQRQLEYDFVVASQADPNPIRLQFAGVDKLAVNPQGDLILKAGGGEVSFHKPVVYQERNGHRELIEARFTLGKHHSVAFHLADYDHSEPLVIDPVLAYSTYLGGSGTNGDAAYAIVVDGAGNAYVTGETESGNFPVTAGSYQQTDKGLATATDNAFIAKLNASGTALLYSTFLGGAGNTAAYTLAVDASGNAYVAGSTSATNFPTTSGAVQTANNQGTGGYNAFVTKLNAAGSALVYSTYLGGSGNGTGTGDAANGIAIDAAGDAYVVGYTYSTNFPVTPTAFQTTNLAVPNAIENAFVTKLNPAGTALTYSTLLGGSGSGQWGEGDIANAIAIDGAGNAYVTGQAGSPDFPATNGAYQTTNPAAENELASAFVAKINPTGTGLVYATYLGGSNFASGSALAIDGAGNAYVTGFAKYTDFPITPGTFQSTNNAAGLNAGNVFVSKVNPSGSDLIYSTWLGGSGLKISTFNTDGDAASGLAIDAAGDVYLTGVAFSSDFPATSGAYQTTNKGAANKTYNSFVTELNPNGTGLVYSTYIGGSGYPFGGMGYYRADDAMALALDSAGNVYVAGAAYSPDYPVSTGPFQSTNRALGNSSSNAFISKLAINQLSTQTTLGSTENPATTGDSVTFTADVTANFGTAAGSVAFAVDGSTVSTVSLSSGVASYSTSTLTAGTHTITASYAGNSTYPASGANLTETVNDPVVAPPALSPAVGTYTAAQLVSLYTATNGATVYFTTDGSTPTNGSNIYTGAVPINSTTTIRAIAVAPGYVNSPVAAGTYTIVLPTATPAFSIAAGTYAGPQTVNLSCSTAGATIYYTTNGVTPTTSSAKYGSALQVTASQTIMAIAVASGKTNSAVASAAYSIQQAAMISPAAGTVFAAPSATFAWTAGSGATGYYLYLGTTGAGSHDITASALLTTTGVTIAGLPVNGKAIYARLYTSINGALTYADYTYTAATQATIISPAAGAVFTGPSVAFTWNAAAGSTAYYLQIGTTGVGSNNIYSSAGKTVTSYTFTAMPTNGGTIYVRLITNFNGTWVNSDTTYKAASRASITSPAAGTVLAGPTVAFTWSSASGITGYYLWIGSTGVGSNNIYNSALKLSTSYTYTAMPTNGETIYVRLTTNYNGTWVSSDYTYTAATQSSFIAPVAGGVLPGSSIPFTWTAAPGATGYYLWIGSTGAGSNNLYNSALKTGTSYTFTAMPINGETIYVRLITNFNGAWAHADYTYSAALPAAMISPTAGATLAGASVPFSWTTSAGATGYFLQIGSTGAGTDDIYNSAEKTVTTYTFTRMPTNGETIYVRLTTNYNGVWLHNDYTYIAQ